VEKKYDHVYRDTIDFVNCIFQDYDFYGEIFNIISHGNNQIELKNKQILKNIDEAWVSVIEDCLINLDNVIRKPVLAIKETEEVLPIELSHNITARSIRHLSQHTDYINNIEGDVITPSKILNVFYEEDILTYENKFVNTLINRLYGFIEKRYSKLKEYGCDEYSSSLNFSSDFISDKSKAKISFNIDVKHKSDQSDKSENDFATATLWERVEHLRSVATGYLGSSFVKNMSGAFVRPPIMRTNAIIKNKDLHKCLELWQFIESYDNIGYEIVVNETAEKPDDDYIKELYSLLSLQYVMFKHNTFELEDEKVVLASKAEEPFKPKIITEFKDFEVEDYNVYDVQLKKVIPISQSKSRKKLSEDELRIRESINIALAANKKIREDKIARIEKEKIMQEKKRIEKEKEIQRIKNRKERIKNHSKKQRIQKKRRKR